VKVIATTPAGLSGAAPAAVNTDPVVYSPAPTMSAFTTRFPILDSYLYYYYDDDDASFGVK
jgi:hypothetical protein